MQLEVGDILVPTASKEGKFIKWKTAKYLIINEIRSTDYEESKIVVMKNQMGETLKENIEFLCTLAENGHIKHLKSDTEKAKALLTNS